MVQPFGQVVIYSWTCQENGPIRKRLHQGAALHCDTTTMRIVASQTDAALQHKCRFRKRMHRGASLQFKHTYRNIHQNAKYSENYITFANNLNHTEYGKTKC